MLQTNNTGVCSQCLGHTGFAPAHGVCAFPVNTAWALGCSARNCLRLALDGSWQSNLEPEQCGQGGYTHCERGQAQCG